MRWKSSTVSALGSSSCPSAHTSGVWIHTAATNTTTLRLPLDPVTQPLTFLYFFIFAPPTCLARQHHAQRTCTTKKMERKHHKHDHTRRTRTHVSAIFFLLWRSLVSHWGQFFFLALLKELVENSKEATKVHTTRTETSQQRQAPTHPALPACGIGSRPASSQTTLHMKWTTSSSIFADKQRRPNPSTVEVLLGTWTPRELSQNPQTPCSIGLRLPHPQPPGGIVRRPRARDTSFPCPIWL